MIREGLEGKRILLTGATGFLGAAILERLLSDIRPERIDLLVRGEPAKRRSWLLAGGAFGPLRGRLGAGEFEALVASRVRFLSCDLATEAPAVAEDVDLAIHAAATVSFDPPVDEAFATNLTGTTRLFTALGGRPFIHVSTAYVAGLTRGIQPEEPLEPFDWRFEADQAEETRGRFIADSMRPEMLERFESRARAEAGRAGPQTVARRAEEMRRDWITERLVRAGRARARSMGWPDVYTFTKALAEIALGELSGGRSLAIIRPSIIESALARPLPGWIEGFRMADPVLLAYGRGTLPEFPGIPEGILDLIPVDLVANCILAVAADPPASQTVFHVSSGARNPLTFRQVYELTREYFLQHPLPEPRGFYAVPEWKFPGKRAIAKRMAAAERVVATAERLVGRIPRSPLARRSARQVDRLRRRLDFIKRYAELYGPYTEAEVVYTDLRTKALYESLPPEDRLDFPFDPTEFTWRSYLLDIHLPMLTAALRWVPPKPQRPQVKIAPSQGDAPALAVFDIEGTLVASNVVEAYLWLRLSELDGWSRAAQAASLAAKLPALIAAERKDRGEFLRGFYKLYEGASVALVRKLAEESMPNLLLRRLAPGARRRIHAHRAAGHRIIFITASLDFVVEPLAQLADHLEAALLSVQDGTFTGDLQKPPMVGEARASWLQDYARRAGSDLAVSYAYGDSLSDLPLLEVVGNPVAVNPDVPLARVARARGWPVEEWEPDPGAPKVMVPEAVR